MNLSTKLQNPLAGQDKKTLEADAVGFLRKTQSDGIRALCADFENFESPPVYPCGAVEDFRRGAVLAGFPHGAETIKGLTPEESTALQDEKTNKRKQPWQIYYVAIISSMAAVVQGME